MMRTHPAIGPREVAPFRSRRWPLLAALLTVLSLAACWFPVERGQRLEQRVDRIEAEGPIRQGGESRAATEEQTRRVEARLAEVQGKLNELSSAAQEGRAERSARQDKLEKLAQEVSHLRASLDGETRRLDAVEKRLAELRATASHVPGRGAPDRKVTAPPEPAKAPQEPAPPKSTSGVLALAREQEAKGQKGVARDLYREYVDKYPTAPDAAQAHFRLGELAFGERRYQDAIHEYGKVANEFPRSDEAPQALLRTADSMMRLDLRDDAVAVLSEIPKRYPSSSAAARARERLAELTDAKAQPKKRR